MREQVMSADPEQPVFSESTMERRIFDAMSGVRFNTVLLGFFGLMALVLAGIGVYGVIAYFVARRTHEIGIRVALGASCSDVMRLVMRQGVAMTSAGLLLGLGGSLLAGRFLAGFLYNVRPADPLTIVGVVTVLGGTALAACYIPARRASHADPMVALRYE